jgi:hypothetical protein
MDLHGIAGGILQDEPSAEVAFGDEGVFRCLIRTVRMPDGRFLGYLYLTYPGDGFSMPHHGVTPTSYATPDDAIEAARPLVEPLAAQWAMDPPDMA